MIKAKKGRVKIIGERATVLSELVTLIEDFARADIAGTLIAMFVGLDRSGFDLNELKEILDDKEFMEDVEEEEEDED